MARSTTRTTAAAVTSVLAMIALAACGSGSSTSGGSSDKTLTVGVGYQSVASPDFAVPFAVSPAYDTLIHQDSDGSYVPDLATSWKFTDKAHTVLEFKLREGMKFSDGSALTAQAAVNSLSAYLKSQPGPMTGAFKSVRAQGDDTVVLEARHSLPMSFVEMTFSQNWGMLVGPDGLADSKSLNTSSDGVGPYKLDGADSSTTVLTYVPNKNYFNQSAIKYDKVVIQTMTDPAARLNALRSGQIDYALSISPDQANTAKSAGLTTSTQGVASPSLFLEPRETGPLSSSDVRQAIEYGIDRDAVLKSIFAGIGNSQSTVAVEGYPGYSEDTASPYPYDTDKAKQLLTSAGYPDGFTMSLLDYTGVDPNGTVAQAMAQELGQIGVKVDIKTVTGTYTNFVNALMTKKYDTTFIAIAGDVYSNYQFSMVPGGFGNLFGAKDARLDKLLSAYEVASTTTDADKTAVEIAQRLDELAWVVMPGVQPVVNAASSSLQNVPATSTAWNPVPFSPDASKAWSSQ